MMIEPFEEQHLSEVLALWNAELEASYPMRRRLLRQNIIEDRRLLREGCLVARERTGSGIVGVVIVKKTNEDDGRFELRADTGWIHLLLVASNGRGKGVGGDLLRQAEDALRSAGVSRVMLGNDLHRRLFPGIPGELTQTKNWFERRGYVCREEVFDLIKTYRPEEEVSLPDMGEAAARIAEPRDREALTAFISRCFPGTWDLQHRDYWEQGGTGREYVVLEKQGKIIGFCRINDDQSPLLAQNVYWAPLFEG